MINVAGKKAKRNEARTFTLLVSNGLVPVSRKAVALYQKNTGMVIPNNAQIFNENKNIVPIARSATASQERARNGLHLLQDIESPTIVRGRRRVDVLTCTAHDRFHSRNTLGFIRDHMQSNMFLKNQKQHDKPVPVSSASAGFAHGDINNGRTK
jgi:hypothetical protein